MRYGERLRAAREHAGLTQAQLAEKIGYACSQENISKLERSETATGSEYTFQFAVGCQVSPYWLAEEKGEMVDSVYIEDEQLKHLFAVCQHLPKYAVDQLIQQGDALAELIKKAQKANEQ